MTLQELNYDGSLEMCDIIDWLTGASIRAEETILKRLGIPRREWDDVTVFLADIGDDATTEEKLNAELDVF